MRKPSAETSNEQLPPNSVCRYLPLAYIWKLQLLASMATDTGPIFWTASLRSFSVGFTSTKPVSVPPLLEAEYLQTPS